MTTSTCAICFDTTDVQIVDISGRMVGLCGVHNNPAAIADLAKLNPTIPSSEDISTAGTSIPETEEALLPSTPSSPGMGQVVQESTK